MTDPGVFALEKCAESLRLIRGRLHRCRVLMIRVNTHGQGCSYGKELAGSKSISIDVVVGWCWFLTGSANMVPIIETDSSSCLDETLPKWSMIREINVEPVARSMMIVECQYVVSRNAN